MADIVRKALDECHSILLDRLQTQEVLDALVAKGVFSVSSDDYEEITAINLARHKARTFLMLIRRHGPGGFSKFVASLKETEQRFLAEKIVTAYEKFRLPSGNEQCLQNVQMIGTSALRENAEMTHHVVANTAATCCRVLDVTGYGAVRFQHLQRRCHGCHGCHGCFSRAPSETILCL